MATNYTSLISPTIVAPLILYVIATTLAIIGNVFDFGRMHTTAGRSYVTLWFSWTCPETSDSCTVTLLRDFPSTVLCNHAQNTLKTAEAFAIITTFLCGLALFVELFILMFQQKVGLAASATVGLIFDILQFISGWITFGLVISLIFIHCDTVGSLHSEGYNHGPCAFMYLGVTIFAMGSAGCHFLTMAQARASQPKVNVPERSRGIAPPAHHPTAQQQQPSVSPAKPGLPARAGPTEMLPLPEGNDWVLDTSGLYWSDSKKLFFDRASGQFYDPDSDQWYNPEQDVWYKL